jgi:PilZ domain
MSATQLIPADRQRQLLTDSAREQRRVVLTHYGPDGWRLYKGKFANGPGGSGSLLVQLPVAWYPEQDRQFRVGDVLGCSFRDGHRKCICSASVEGVQSDAVHVTITLRKPEQIQQLQRRAFERAVPPENTVIAVRFWREESATSPGTGERIVRHGQLVDISAGGMRVTVSDINGVDMDLTYRCAFTPGPGKPAFVLDGLLRHEDAGEHGRTALGFQFVGLETTPEGRKTLDRLAGLVNRFQRSRQRRRQHT